MTDKDQDNLNKQAGRAGNNKADNRTDGKASDKLHADTVDSVEIVTLDDVSLADAKGDAKADSKADSAAGSRAHAKQDAKRTTASAEYIAEDAGVADADENENEPTGKTQSSATTASTGRGLASWLAAGALLLAILALIGVVWIWWQADQEAQQQQMYIEELLNANAGSVQSQTALAQDLSAEIERLQSNLQKIQQQRNAASELLERQVQQKLESMTQRLNIVDDMMVETLNMSAGQRDSVNIAQVESLIDIALREVDLNQDAKAAGVALEQAQVVMQQLAGRYPALKQSIARAQQELANKVIKPAYGSWVQQLNQARTQLATLPLHAQTPLDAEANVAANNEASNSATASDDSIWADFKPFFYVEQAAPSKPAVAELLPSEQQSIRQNAMLQIQVAQLYVAQRDEQLFQETLSSLQAYVETWYQDNASRQQLLAQFTNLRGQSFAVQMPSLSYLKSSLQRARQIQEQAVPPSSQAPQSLRPSQQEVSERSAPETKPGPADAVGVDLMGAEPVAKEPGQPLTNL